MNKEKDFFKTCFDTVAGLEVKNESQAIAKEVVLSEIGNLQEENEILKGNAEHNAKAVDKINWENMLLKKENQELKSQLRGTTHCFDEEEHNKLKEENQKLKKQLEEIDRKLFFIKNELDMRQKSIDNKLNQQKEFINYLKDEIKRINPNDLYIGELNLRLDDIKFTQYLIYKEVLQKYKEIIGDDK